MKKIILRLIILVLIINSMSISTYTAGASTILKEYDMTINVGIKKSLVNAIVGQSVYTPQGKYKISDSSIVGIECRYDKKRRNGMAIW
ncbi:MAG: hypothetical protein E7255_01585 [Lachnospiraceae bacterium]|jgi:hypothetical protein|nr:hypothetical protein [Lachnospiraceae bacterium]